MGPKIWVRRRDFAPEASIVRFVVWVVWSVKVRAISPFGVGVADARRLLYCFGE